MPVTSTWSRYSLLQQRGHLGGVHRPQVLVADDHLLIDDHKRRIPERGVLVLLAGWVDEHRVGEAVGVIAAQSIGEAGTQLTLRSFHVGGTASKIADENKLIVKHSGKIEIDDLRTVARTTDTGEVIDIVVSRSAELKVVEEKTGVILSTNNINLAGRCTCVFP